MLRCLLLLSLNIYLLILACLPAQAAQVSIGERFSINSTVLQHQQSFQVLLPERYHSNPEASYPVIYLLDGDYNFHGVTGMLDLLANKAQRIPDVIVVGIAANATAQYRRYMTPASLTPEQPADKAGQAERFLTFINNELKPHINQHFRTAAHTTLVGQSMGGVFVLNTLLDAPQSFHHYVAISPAVWLHEHALANATADKLKKAANDTAKQPASLFISLGDENRMGVYGFVQQLDELQPAHIDWQLVLYPDENHNSVGIITLRDALKHQFDGWFISETKLRQFSSPQAILAHYQQQLQRFDIKQPLPQAAVKAIIRHYYVNENTEQIAQLLQKVKQQLPTSEQAFLLMHASYMAHFDSADAAIALLSQYQQRFAASLDYLTTLADLYLQQGNRKKAHEVYQQALTLANRQHANQWQLSIINAGLEQTKNN